MNYFVRPLVKGIEPLLCDNVMGQRIIVMIQRTIVVGQLEIVIDSRFILIGPW